MEGYNGSISKMKGARGEYAVSACKVQPVRSADAEYRDYFVQALSFLCRVLSHYAFRFAASAVGFACVLIFTLGVVGGVELEILPLACCAPLCVMLACIFLLINKARK